MPPQKKSDSLQPPAWHPNLRIEAKLPDTKVVRTDFLVNGIAVTVLLVFVLWCGIREWTIRSLGEQIDETDRLIQRDEPLSRRAVELYGKFTKEQAKTEEVVAFMKSRPTVSDIFLRIGQTLPKKIAIESVDIGEKSVVLKGTVRGLPEKASGDASAYEAQLRHDPILGELFSEVHIISLTRNPQTDRLMIQISMEFKKELLQKT
jgi:hypothetical protein